MRATLLALKIIQHFQSIADMDQPAITAGILKGSPQQKRVVFIIFGEEHIFHGTHIVDKFSVFSARKGLQSNRPTGSCFNWIDVLNVRRVQIATVAKRAQLVTLSNSRAEFPLWISNLGETTRTLPFLRPAFTIHDLKIRTTIKRRPTDDDVLAEIMPQLPQPRPGRLERELLKVFEESPNERTIHTFLKRRAFLVSLSFRSSTNPGGVASEFQLGKEFRPDFLVMSYCSAWWSLDFVELESPSSRLYLADGTESRALRIAKRQVRDWSTWIRENESYFRKRLSEFFGRIQQPATGASSVPDAATEILLPFCALTYCFYIVIGRRSALSSREQQARVQDSLDQNVRIATYDRFSEVARRYDRATAFGKQSIRYWDRLKTVDQPGYSWKLRE